MSPCNRIELHEFKFLVRMLLLILSCVVDMAFTDAFFVAYGYEFYEFVL